MKGPLAALSRGWNAPPPAQLCSRFRAIGANPAQFEGLFEFDNSDAVSAGYMVRAPQAAPRGTLIVIDCLQLPRPEA